jgi:outer membrane protein assembly factor BamB
MLRILLFVVCLGVILTPASTEEPPTAPKRNWPQWRGPLATGVAPRSDPPVEWSETKNVRWKTEIPGKGHSTPIVWGQQIFLTTALATDKPVDPEVVAAVEERLPEWRRGQGAPPSKVLQFVVMALDRSDGRILWSRTLREAAPHEGTHQTASWASHSPVTDGEYLVAHFGSHGTYVLDLDGNVKWERDLGDMTTRNAFGEGSSPALHGETLVVNWDHEGESFIIALDRKTGETRWTVDRDEATSWSTPIVVVHGGKPQVIVSATKRTRGYDLATGKSMWEAGGMTLNTIPSPVFADGRVFVASGFRGNALQAIDLAAAKGDITGSEAIVWQHDKDTPYVPSPVLYGEHICFLKSNDNIFSCVEAATGKAVYGPQRLEGVEGVYASPVGAAGRIYIAGRNGVTIVVKQGSEFEVLATNSLDDGFDASPAIAGDELYLRGQKHLYCIAREGED